MYEALTTNELAVLQNMLYGGTEDVYCMAGLNCDDPESMRLYRSAHWEIAQLFIEAATELIGRLDEEPQAA